MTKLFLLSLSALLATVISYAQLASSAGYPWNGDVEIVVEKTALRGEMALRIRIPGWVRGAVVPSDLYTYADDVSLGYSVSLNGEKVEGELVNGYFVIARKWKKGDKAHAAVAADQGRIAVERGPVVYCAEWPDNAGFSIHSVLMNRHPQFTVIPASGSALASAPAKWPSGSRSPWPLSAPKCPPPCSTTLFSNNPIIVPLR